MECGGGEEIKVGSRGKREAEKEEDEEEEEEEEARKLLVSGV